MVLAISGNCALSSLRNREVSTIEGALIHTGIGSCISDFIIVRCKEAVRHSGVFHCITMILFNAKAML